MSDQAILFFNILVFQKYVDVVSPETKVNSDNDRSLLRDRSGGMGEINAVWHIRGWFFTGA